MEVTRSYSLGDGEHFYVLLSHSVHGHETNGYSVQTATNRQRRERRYFEDGENVRGHATFPREVEGL